ncbi:FAD-dependent oxidoreductase [Streptomyces sp. NBC_01102]|uniref:NAD(P)/FAD-dependent oxidoreductase n=1 Tax=Streptomyces sp. NBC_01102 TaxID=2903749 RepID=UPI00386A5043|nr:FAD-dependent oxidoreductase [Streptomyces sp. NBC_01102]
MTATSSRPRDIVIVGASLAGVRAAETLRAEGFTGRLTLVGNERLTPYDRPPLSKEFLTAEHDPPATRLPVSDGLRARWLLGRTAVALDLRARTVAFSDGTRLPYDGLVIATGATARRSAGPPAPSRGVFTLRGHDDATRLRGALAQGRSLLVVGAGFLGGEIAAAGRARGLDVTLVETGAAPLERVVGPEVGAFVAMLHREAGIDLRTDTAVTEFRTAADGGLSGARLTDGTDVTADAAVLALGALPATDWLSDSGLRTDGGVHCDTRLRALALDGTPVPDVVVAGDVARAPQPLADGAALALGHWTNAVDQAVTAARTLLRGAGSPAFDEVPSFWSDLHGVRIRSVGLPVVADTVEIHEIDSSTRRLEASYHRAGRLVGALTIGRAARLAAYHRSLAEASRAHRSAA